MAARTRSRSVRAPAASAAGTLPADFDPQLAELATTPPMGDGWLHEIKLDGYRMGCRIEAGQVRLLGRRGTDWGAKFPEICRAAAGLTVETALLDGEVAVVDARGVSHFADLQALLSGGRRAGLVYFVFDLLHLDGEDVSRLPLVERKRRVHELLARLTPGQPLRPVDHIVGNGPAVFAEAQRMGLEGTIAKRADEPYHHGRGPGWLKIKTAARQELAVGGFTHPKGNRSGIGALLLGHYDAGGFFRYAGKVGTGFTEQVATALRGRLEPLQRTTCPFTPPPEALIRRDAHWVEPSVVVEVRFSNWTPDGRLRHASFEGLRVDKDAREVRREAGE
jgi:bifunctional non-homologous end joining protein LigD